MSDLKKQVDDLSQYLSDEAIADALRITPETVKDIREGRAEIEEYESQEHQTQEPVIRVNSVKTAYRQKVISVMRAKGGVGCTVTSIALAYLISKEISVLLVDLNFASGGSDLKYYLNLPDYPHIGVMENSLDEGVIHYEPNFFVLQPPRNISNEEKKINQIIDQAREDFDAIVFDLPNRIDDDCVHKVLRKSNTIVAVTGGMLTELTRLGVVLSEYGKKHIIVAANRCNIPEEAKEIFENCKIEKVDHDHTLDKTFEKCDLPSEKSTFMSGVKKVKENIFETKKQEGLLKRIFGGV